MKESAEYRTFKELIDNSREYANIILIIDESHLNTHTDKAKEIIQLINPKAIIEMTATPKDFPYYRKWKIEKEEVIKAGLIKEQICINKFVKEINKEGTIPFLIQATEDRRRQLEKLYKEEGININPLVLIQIPDAKEGEELKDKIIEELKNIGISMDLGNLGIWLSEDKKKEGIEDIDSPIKYLIFKQAIAKGWDCPRAQILLKFRHTKGDAFEKQTIGRILRMPEAKHYDIKELNMAYIYTDDEEFILNAMRETDAVEYTEPINIKQEHKDFVTKFVIPCEKIENITKKEIDLEKFKEILEDKLFSSESFKDFELGDIEKNNNLLKSDNNPFNTSLKEASEQKITTNEILSVDLIDSIEKKQISAVKHEIIKRNYEDIDREFNRKFRIISKDFNLKDLYFEFTEEYLGWDIVKSKKLFILNFDNIFRDIFVSAMKEYENKYLKSQKTIIKDFTFTEPIYYNRNKNIEKAVIKNLMKNIMLVEKLLLMVKK